MILDHVTEAAVLFYAVIPGFLLVLLLRPNWGLLGFFTGVIAVGWFRFGPRAFPDMNFLYVVLLGAAQAGLFYAIGALIVWLRGAKRDEPSPSEKEIDAELARVRAENATPDRVPPST